MVHKSLYNKNEEIFKIVDKYFYDNFRLINDVNYISSERKYSNFEKWEDIIKEMTSWPN